MVKISCAVSPGSEIPCRLQSQVPTDEGLQYWFCHELDCCHSVVAREKSRALMRSLTFPGMGRKTPAERIGNFSYPTKHTERGQGFLSRIQRQRSSFAAKRLQILIVFTEMSTGDCEADSFLSASVYTNGNGLLLEGSSGKTTIKGNTVRTENRIEYPVCW